MQVIEPLVRSRTILFFTFIFLISLKGFAQIYPDDFVHNSLKKGINLIIDQKYDEAKIVFNNLDAQRKDLPFGKIYLAAVSIAQAYDYEEQFDDDLIMNYLETAKKLSEKLVEKDVGNIWNHYFLALSEGYIAYYDALRNNWLSAFSTGINSIKSFEICLEQDENFYEALIALGSYKFWKSKKTEFLSWLPFFDDETEIGIKYLQDAVEYSGYNSHLAIHSLVWIYIEQDKFNKAREVAELALIQNPDSRIFKWGLARACEEIDPVKAATLYLSILNSFPVELKSNRINIVTLKHLAAQQLKKANKISEALKLCDEILSLNGYSDYELSKIKSRLSRVKTLRAELKN